MVIEKVHGLQATSMSLNDRFTLLANITPERVSRQQQPRRRSTMAALLSENFYKGNRHYIEQVARQFEQQARRAIKQRLGLPQPIRRYGSESNLPRLRRSNSAGNIREQSVQNRVAWRQANGTLGRSASFNNLATYRGNRRRGSGQRQQRGRNSRPRGMAAMNGGGAASRAQYRAFQRARQRTGRTTTRGRGGLRNQQKSVTKEELDQQLDQYMAGTKAALDEELDNYMKNAMELE